jgi:hypothetical protein
MLNMYDGENIFIRESQLNTLAKLALKHGRAWYDYKGKDCSYDRWRIDIYYSPHRADCLLLPEKEYNDFQKRHVNCAEYAEWRRLYELGKI